MVSPWDRDSFAYSRKEFTDEKSIVTDRDFFFLLLLFFIVLVKIREIENGLFVSMDPGDPLSTVSETSPGVSSKDEKN